MRNKHNNKQASRHQQGSQVFLILLLAYRGSILYQHRPKNNTIFEMEISHAIVSLYTGRDVPSRV